jgi:prefoldin subunit 5
MAEEKNAEGKAARSALGKRRAATIDLEASAVRDETASATNPASQPATDAPDPVQPATAPATPAEAAAGEVVTGEPPISQPTASETAASTTAPGEPVPEVAPGAMRTDAAGRSDEPPAPPPEPPQAAEPRPEMVAPATPPPARRGGGSMLAAGIAGLLMGAIGGGAVAWYLGQSGTAQLQQRISLLEAAPRPPANVPTAADVQGVGQRLTAAERSLTERLTALDARLQEREQAATQLRERADGLEKALSEVRTAAGNASESPDISPLQQRLSALDERVKGLDERMASLRELEPRMKALDGKVVGLEGRITAVAPKLEETSSEVMALVPKVGAAEKTLAETGNRVGALDKRLGAVDERLQGLDTRLGQLASRQQAGSAAAVLAASQALFAAFDRGQPFARELAALDTLGVEAARLEPLRAAAAAGAPTLASLQGDLKRLTPAILSAGKPGTAQADSLLDWASSAVNTLVQSRPVGTPSGPDPGAILARVETALQAGNVPRALSEWAALPEVNRQPGAAFASRLALRAEADKALVQLEQAALERLKQQ